MYPSGILPGVGNTGERKQLILKEKRGFNLQASGLIFMSLFTAIFGTIFMYFKLGCKHHQSSTKQTQHIGKCSMEHRYFKIQSAGLLLQVQISDCHPPWESGLFTKNVHPTKMKIKKVLN